MAAFESKRPTAVESDSDEESEQSDEDPSSHAIQIREEEPVVAAKEQILDGGKVKLILRLLFSPYFLPVELTGARRAESESRCRRGRDDLRSASKLGGAQSHEAV